MKIFITTLGCFKNQVDSEVIASRLLSLYTLTDDPRSADVIIINTCAFIEEAKQESIDRILSYGYLKEKKIIVCGCLGQRYAAEILEEIPEVDAVVGTYASHRILDVIERVRKSERVINVCEPVADDLDYAERALAFSSHYAFVKIADGCNRQCSFCIIPSLKGPLRSRDMGSIEKEIRILMRKGVKELIIIAQDTTAYGLDRYGKKSIVDLLEKLVLIDGIQWIRMLYNFPGEIDERLIDLIVSENKLCNCLDIPIQHISDTILQRMKREVSGKHLRQIIARLRERYPQIFLRTTIMVGFPGETEQDFKELCDFIEEIKFERLGVFLYSREYGTESYSMEGHIAQEVKEERASMLMEIQRIISLEKNKEFLGRTIPVIIDEKIGEMYTFDGRTEYDAPEIDNGVLITKGEASTGDIVPVRITEVTEYDLIGTIEKRGKPV